MNELERYLRRATRGLPAKVRHEAVRELRGHVIERACEWQSVGLSREEAVHKTLGELGDPHQVSAGLLGIHVVPLLARVPALLALLAALIVTGSGREWPGVISALSTTPVSSLFWQKPYVPGSAKPIPIPTCSGAKVLPVPWALRVRPGALPIPACPTDGAGSEKKDAHPLWARP